MRNIRVITASVCFLIGLSFFMATAGFADDTDPDGSRGIKWGTNINELSGMMPCRPSKLWVRELGFENDPNFLQEVTTYLRAGDRLAIGQVPLRRIEYGFWRGRFIGVAFLYTPNGDNDVQVTQYAMNLFGREPLRGIYDGPYNTYIAVRDSYLFLSSGQLIRERFGQKDARSAQEKYRSDQQLRQQF